MKRPVRRSRMFGWDHNPLRRRIDRVEGGMIAGLIVLFLIAAPVLATVAGNWTRTVGTRQQHIEATWRQVSATVSPGPPAQRDYLPGPAGTVSMLAHWTAPDGQSRYGWLPFGPGTAPGSSSRVWVNRWGSLTGPPLRHTQLQGRIAVAEMLTACVLGLVLSLVGGTGRYLLRRRRLAHWDMAWRTWSHSGPSSAK